MTAVSLRERLLRRKHAAGEALRDAASFLRFQSRRLGLARRRRRPGGKPRLLILDELLPDPRFGAGFPRAAELLQGVLTAGWDATVYPINAGRDDYRGVQARFPRGVTFLRARDEPGMRRLMQETIGVFDAVLISRPTVMERFARISATLPSFAARTYCIYDAEAAFTAREALRRRLFGVPMSDAEFETTLAEEIGLVRGVRAVISVTEAEARLFRARTPVPVRVISHTTPVREAAPGFKGRTDLLFVGKATGQREFSPNVDSLVWFIEEVMPLLDLRMGTGYRLVIAGLVDAALSQALASERVVFLGIVDDLAPWYDRSRLFVAPTRFAAGMPLKVVEAAAAGVPCVVTTLLADQLRFTTGTECLVAATAPEFAARCAELYGDEHLWTSIRDTALARISNDYSRAAFEAGVREVLAGSVRRSTGTRER